MDNAQKTNATKALFARLETLERANGLPKQIKLAVYESDADLRYFRPDEPWDSNAEHTDYVNSVALAIGVKYGGAVDVLTDTINRADYLNWLNKEGLKDEPSRRAQYISIYGG